MESSNRGFVYRWSSHAIDRWGERFQGIDKHADFASATRAGKKSKKKIKDLTPFNYDRYMRGFKGRYALVSRSQIVYIIASDGGTGKHTIITVFHIYRDRD